MEGGGGGGGGRNRPLDGRNGDETQQMIRRAIMAAVISTMDAILPGEFPIPNRIFSSLDIEKLDRCQRLSGFSNDTRFGNKKKNS